MGWQQLAGGRASRKDKAGRPPARSRGPVRGRSLGLLEDVKRTVGRVNGGWVHPQSQAARFDSCLSGGLFIDGEAALDPGGGAAVDVADRGVAEMPQVAGRGETPLAAVADGQDRPIT